MFFKSKIQTPPTRQIPTPPRKEVYFTEKQLEAQGFPKEMSKAFFLTADGDVTQTFEHNLN